MNAFELISRSQGFSLENMFEKHKGYVKRETSFVSKSPATEAVLTCSRNNKCKSFGFSRQVLEEGPTSRGYQDKKEGLDSLVVQDGLNWSLGQRQLFCLGLALLKR